MKNLLKFLLFVGLLAAAISALYDYRIKHGGLRLSGKPTPEKYTLASQPIVDPNDGRDFGRGQPGTARLGLECDPIGG